VKPAKKNEFMVAFGNTMGGKRGACRRGRARAEQHPKKAVESAAAGRKDAGAQFVVIERFAKAKTASTWHPSSSRSPPRRSHRSTSSTSISIC